MKKLHFLTILFITSIVFSCNKESFDQPIKSNPIGTISDRTKAETCNCDYMITDIQSDMEEVLKYTLSDLNTPTSNPCTNCTAGRFYNYDDICFPFGNDPCKDLGGLNVWHSFNCQVPTNDQFITNFNLTCCDDYQCGTNGEITFLIRCRTSQLAPVITRGNDGTPGASGIACPYEVSDPITIQYDSGNPFNSMTNIKLEGNCGCTPVEI